MTPRRWRRLWVIVAVAVAAGACGDNSPSTLDPKGPGAESIADVWWIMFGLATFVYVVVGGFIVVAALRGRRTEEGRPSKISDRAFIWIGGIIAPAVILAVLAVVTVNASNEQRPRASGNVLRIEVTGYRWWWDVRYPDLGVVTANEIRIPAGRPIDVGLHSGDVLHSFWVPELAGKLDQVPGQHNILRIRADRPGVYRGLCAEFCGVQHAKMQFLVIAETPADFERWIVRQQRPRAEPPSEEAALGQVVFNRSACSGCHAVRGNDQRQVVGPNLSDFGSRRTLGAVSAPNTPENLGTWITNSHAIKPENLMPPIYLAPDEVRALVAYLESLS